MTDEKKQDGQPEEPKVEMRDLEPAEDDVRGGAVADPDKELVAHELTHVVQQGGHLEG